MTRIRIPMGPLLSVRAGSYSVLLFLAFFLGFFLQDFTLGIKGRFECLLVGGDEQNLVAYFVVFGDLLNFFDGGLWILLIHSSDHFHGQVLGRDFGLKGDDFPFWSQNHVDILIFVLNSYFIGGLAVFHFFLGAHNLGVREFLFDCIHDSLGHFVQGNFFFVGPPARASENRQKTKGKRRAHK